LLTSSGLFQELESAIASETKTYDLPAMEQPLSGGITRVVVDPGRRPVNLEAGGDAVIHVFGTYRATVPTASVPPIGSAQDYVMSKVVGDTLYLELKEPKRKEGPFQSYTALEATLIVPAAVRLEVRGNYNEIDLSAPPLASDWLIENAGQIRVHLREQDNLQITATSSMPLEHGSHPWDVMETGARAVEGERHDSTWYKGTMKIGEGVHQLKILNSGSVSVDLMKAS
jgi:hypothetical protein